MKKILFILAATVALAGCQDEEKALYAAPVIRPVGTFEGCVVKFVDRGWKAKASTLLRVMSHRLLVGMCRWAKQLKLGNQSR